MLYSPTTFRKESYFETIFGIQGRLLPHFENIIGLGIKRILNFHNNYIGFDKIPMNLFKGNTSSGFSRDLLIVTVELSLS